MFKIILKNKKKVSPNEYLFGLKQCELVAKSEYKILKSKIDELKEFINKSTSSIKNINESIQEEKNLQDEELGKLLNVLYEKLSEELNFGLKETEIAILKKKNNLKHFTITLFGKTKSGKSTIREALTIGSETVYKWLNNDGSKKEKISITYGESIGKGDQRTTRDIFEYFWNNLRILDTPGIAAYKGEEDTKIAENVIEESDLILFLVTNDSIQSTEFEKLSEIKAHNKPIIILLNVKQDIDKEIYLKRFLRDYEKTVSKEGQAGNVERIRALSRLNFGHSDIEIIPIHAYSAFKSNICKDKELKEKLFVASQINKFKYLLRKLIIGQGIQKRTITFRDDYIFYLNSIESVYWDYYKKIKPRVKYLDKKLRDLIDWFEKFIPEKKEFIYNRVSEVFAPLFEEIDDFVDMYAGKEGADKKWEHILKNAEIETQCKNIQRKVINDINEYLENFSKETKFDLQNINFDIEISDITKGVLGRVTRWGGVGVSSLLIIGGLANWWNPFGLVALSISAVSIIGTIFSFFIKSDTHKHEKAKQEAKIKIRKQLSSNQYSALKSLKKWLNDEIIKGINKKLRKDLYNKIQSLNEFINNLYSESQSLDEMLMNENISLYNKLYLQSFKFKKEKCKNILRIARYQGSVSKILVKDSILEGKEIHLFESIVGERIFIVQHTSDNLELLIRALKPADILREQIFYDTNKNRYVLNLPKNLIGKTIGKNGINIKLASKLLNYKIQIKEINNE